MSAVKGDAWKTPIECCEYDLSSNSCTVKHWLRELYEHILAISQSQFVYICGVFIGQAGLPWAIISPLEIITSQSKPACRMKTP